MVKDCAEFDRKLVLEGGLEFYGYGFGASVDAIHDLTFSTLMGGYHEVVTDLSNADRFVVMTYPVIGNYGMTDEDLESTKPQLGGLIVREYNDAPSNFRYTKTLDEEMEENGIPGLEGVDTRRIMRELQKNGAQKAMITRADTPVEEALSMIRAHRRNANPVSRVTCRKKWYSRTPNPICNVVALDLGIRLSLVRRLNALGANVTVVPYDTGADEILRLNPDGLFLSSGPGDPAEVESAIHSTRALIGKLPVFGTGLGCLVLGLASGASAIRLKNGHHGANRPVRRLDTGLIEMATQNSLFAIDEASLEATGLTVTHVDALDGAIEGIERAADKAFGVQFYPDATPRRADEEAMMQKFMRNIAEWRDGHA